MALGQPLSHALICSISKGDGYKIASRVLTFLLFFGPFGNMKDDSKKNTDLCQILYGVVYILFAQDSLIIKDISNFNIRQIFTSTFLRRNLLLCQVYCLDAGTYCHENDTPWLPSNK